MTSSNACDWSARSSPTLCCANKPTRPCYRGRNSSGVSSKTPCWGCIEPRRRVGSSWPTPRSSACSDTVALKSWRSWMSKRTVISRVITGPPSRNSLKRRAKSWDSNQPGGDATGPPSSFVRTHVWSVTRKATSCTMRVRLKTSRSESGRSRRCGKARRGFASWRSSCRRPSSRWTWTATSPLSTGPVWRCSVTRNRMSTDRMCCRCSRPPTGRGPGGTCARNSPASRSRTTNIRRSGRTGARFPCSCTARRSSVTPGPSVCAALFWTFPTASARRRPCGSPRRNSETSRSSHRT